MVRRTTPKPITALHGFGHDDWTSCGRIILLDPTSSTTQMLSDKEALSSFCCFRRKVLCKLEAAAPSHHLSWRACLPWQWEQSGKQSWEIPGYLFQMTHLSLWIQPFILRVSSSLVFTWTNKSLPIFKKIFWVAFLLFATTQKEQLTE